MCKMHESEMQALDMSLAALSPEMAVTAVVVFAALSILILWSDMGRHRRGGI